MKTGFDISRIDGDGYLILPLSLAKLANGFGQDPTQCYAVLEHFASKLERLSNDVVFLYTTGLYLNTVDLAYEKRKKLNQKAIQHARELRKLIADKKQYIPNAFHFLPIDYVILNSEYSEYFSILQRMYAEDTEFATVVTADAKGPEPSKAEIYFILEELAVSHIIRQKQCPLPRTLVTSDTWRLITYPGKELESDKYQHQHNFLPKQSGNTFAGGVYNFTDKTYINFDERL